MASIYLGADIGTTSAKCIAVREDGEILAISQLSYPTTHPQQGWAEQDPEDFWHGLVETVRGCLRACARQRYTKEHVVSLALSTQGDTLIVTDSAGKPLTPAIGWMDARGETEFAELLAEADASFWYRETGSPLTVLSSACAIRWLARRRPDVVAAKPRYCYVADYLAKRLRGEFVTDMPSASWTPLFSPVRREWSQPVLDLLGVPRDALPAVVESGEAIGRLLPEAARELGLSPNTKLVAGAFDQAAAAHGAGARANATGVLSCGAAWVLYIVSAGPITDPNERLCTCCHTGPGECALVLPFTGGSAYDWLNRMVSDDGEDARPNADPLTFIPHLYGGLSPDWHGESRGSLIGLTLAHTAGDVRLALMRGLAFEARRNTEAAAPLLTKEGSGEVERIRMVGGAGKSKVWPKIIANVLNLPVDVPDCVESACYGAAKLAAGDASANWAEAGTLRRFQPSAQDVRTEDRLYEDYIRIYSALLPLYQS